MTTIEPRDGFSALGCNFRALRAIVVYQLVLLYQFERQLPLGRGLKALLRAA